MFLPPLRPAITILTLGLLASTGLQAQQTTQDAPAIDASQLLKQLKELKTQETEGIKALKQAASQQVAAAASSADSAVAMWEEAIRVTQMEGAGKEGATSI